MSQSEDTTRAGKWKQLSERERHVIEALLKRKLGVSAIAKELCRDRRTIEREIRRGSVIQRDTNWIDRLVYRSEAGTRVRRENSANKGRPLKIGNDHALSRHIEKKIVEGNYSPDAVIGEIKAKGLKFKTTLCTKTVYNYIDAGIFFNLSNQDLPVKRRGKKRRYRQVRKVALNNLRGRSIEERDKAVESRLEYGHWEMDCVVGKGKACLLVLTERSIREEIIFKIPSKTQLAVISIVDKLELTYGKEFRETFKSITMDNGSEFLDIEGLEASKLYLSERRTKCYYTHPYSAWERGSNENANKLIRRFVPKGSGIEELSDNDVKRIEHWMNNYPRRILGYKSANECKAGAIRLG